MRQTEMKQNLPADTELDAVLAQMAEEVPPMPADFHARWMDAVRAESGPAEEKTHVRAGSIVLWTRILSVAAAFVFLIGGTLLYRNSRKSLDAVYQAEEKNTEITVYEETAAGEAPETAAGMDAEAPEANAGIAVMGFSAMKASEAREADAMMAEEAAVMESAEEEPEPEEDAEENAILPDEEPEEEPDEETAGETEEPEGFLQTAGRFFTDMGDFLLAALPYLLVLAVPAAAALIIRKRKTK